MENSVCAEYIIIEPQPKTVANIKTATSTSRSRVGARVITQGSLLPIISFQEEEPFFSLILVVACHGLLNFSISDTIDFLERGNEKKKNNQFSRNQSFQMLDFRARNVFALYLHSGNKVTKVPFCDGENFMIRTYIYIYVWICGCRVDLLGLLGTMYSRIHDVEGLLSPCKFEMTRELYISLPLNARIIIVFQGNVSKVTSGLDGF